MKLIELLQIVDSKTVKLVDLNNKVLVETDKFSELKEHLPHEVKSVRAQQNKICIQMKFETCLTDKQAHFSAFFPEKEIDCEIPNYINSEELIEEIKKSTFLTKRNLPLSWYVYNYQRIMRGEFRDVRSKR